MKAILDVTKTDIKCPNCKNGVLVMTPFKEAGARKGFRDNVAIDCSTSEDIDESIRDKGKPCDYIQAWYCKLTVQFIKNRRDEL